MAKQSHGVRYLWNSVIAKEAMAEWLAKHGLDAANAEMLADTEVTFGRWTWSLRQWSDRHRTRWCGGSRRWLTNLTRRFRIPRCASQVW